LTAPRVRFAPSPTGFFHVGSARTALFNWLFARGNRGVFVLRIEDTDVERNREEWVGGIESALEWLQMAPDEGPFRQSAQDERHRVAIDALFEAGFLYACDCTREEIAERTKDNPTPGYDGYCRERHLERGPTTALRFKTPPEGSTTVVDLIRGEIVFPHSAMDDFVAVKSTGQPLFALANVNDDRDMGITHVIRGEDLLPTTPRQLLLWAALDEAGEGEAGWGERTQLPVFAHLPMLVDERGKKLSKRKDPVAVEDYRDKGYLPEAFRNYLALLGWSPKGDAEIVPVETLIEQFRLEDVHHAPAFFDVKKFTHMNGVYIRELPVEEFIERSKPWVAPELGEWTPSTAGPPWPAERFDADTFARLAPLVQERVATLGEVPAMVDFIFLADPPYDEAQFDSVIVRDEGAVDILDGAVAVYSHCEWRAADLHDLTLEMAERLGKKLGKAQAPIRVAVTGRKVGPPLFEALEVLGRDEVLRRLQAALALRAARVGTGPPG
jgi:glutamyl-tRNA synthetase